MKINLKWIVLLEALMIAALLTYFALPMIQDTLVPQKNHSLIAPGIDAGLVTPQGFSIFNFNDMQGYLENYTRSNNFDVSMYVVNLRNDNNFAINGDLGSYPGSLNKIPIAVLVLNKVEKGEISMDTQIKIDHANLTSDSDPAYFYKNKMTIRELIERMLKESDNTAFHVLAAQVNFTDLGSLMTYYDVDAAESFTYPSAEAINNTFLRPQSFSNMFLSLYFSTVLNADDSQYILDILSNTTMNMNEVADLPQSVVVTHKWGAYIDNGLSVFNDCGIIYIPNSAKILYCLTIRGQSLSQSTETLGKIVHTIYTFYVNSRQAHDLLRQYFVTNT